VLQQGSIERLSADVLVVDKINRSGWALIQVTQIGPLTQTGTLRLQIAATTSANPCRWRWSFGLIH